MLEIAVIVLLVVLAIGAMIPVYWVWAMIIDYYRNTKPTPPVQEPTPSAAIILCLRGADPSLTPCLQGLLAQDYPRYQIRIVVDHVNDTAWAKVHEILAQSKPGHVPVDVSVLEKHCPTCSLKVCSQLQAVSKLGPDVDVVVLIDADSIPGPDWLRAMIAPFSDPKIGVSTGLRWFAPVDAGWGSLVRYVFNAGSYPQMFAFDHTWGGSMAIRIDLFRKSSLKQKWCQALCEDSAVTGPMRELGLKLAWVPAAANINPETISLEACIRFVQRQLLCVRLDHVDWLKLLACNMFNTFAVFALLALTALGVYVERWDLAGAAGGIFLGFILGLYAGLQAGEWVIRRNHRIRGLNPPPMVWTWKMFPAFVFTQFLCMRLLWRAHFMKQVAWRGINYRIEGPGNIHLDQYEPYKPPGEAPAHHSTV